LVGTKNTPADKIFTTSLLTVQKVCRMVEKNRRRSEEDEEIRKTRSLATKKANVAKVFNARKGQRESE